VLGFVIDAPDIKAGFIAARVEGAAYEIGKTSAGLGGFAAGFFLFGKLACGRTPPWVCGASALLGGFAGGAAADDVCTNLVPGPSNVK
jgi:hypothetical protein